VIRTRRLWTTTFLSLVFFCFVAGRLSYLQLYCHAALQERVNKEQSRVHDSSDVPPRGAILDRTGAVLALSIHGGGCFADPHRVQQVDETVRLLAPLLQQTPSVLKAKLIQHKRFVWLARRLDPETAEQVKALKRPGVTVTTDMKRFLSRRVSGRACAGSRRRQPAGIVRRRIDRRTVAERAGGALSV